MYSSCSHWRAGEVIGKHFPMSGGNVGCQNCRKGTADTWWVEVNDAANRLPCMEILPPRTKNYLA